MTAPSIADEITTELEAPRNVRPCIVGSFIDRLDEDDRRAVKRALALPRTAATVWRVLTRRGLSASASQVRIHARRDCNCTPAGHTYHEGTE